MSYWLGDVQYYFQRALTLIGNTQDLPAGELGQIRDIDRYQVSRAVSVYLDHPEIDEKIESIGTWPLPQARIISDRLADGWRPLLNQGDASERC